MRHYEIIANRCVPIFTYIEDCPKHTLTSLPKELLSSIKKMQGLNLVKWKETKDNCYGGHLIKQGESFLDESFSDTE